MMQFLEFTFQSFWTFCGVCIILCITYNVLDNIIGNLCRTIIHSRRRVYKNEPPKTSIPSIIETKKENKENE